MASISFGTLPCRKKKLDDSSRLDVVEIARVPDMLPSFFPSCSGYELISTPVHCEYRQRVEGEIVSERHCFNAGMWDGASSGDGKWSYTFIWIGLQTNQLTRD